MHDLLMPKLGLTMTEGLLSEWHVAIGDTVAPGDILFTVETEKVANEVEAENAGTLAEILTPTGETVPVGHVVARISGSGDVALSPPKEKKAAATVALDDPASKDSVPDKAKRIVATPLARRVAAQQGVDLQSLDGSGPKGRIKVADVRAASTNTPQAPAITDSRSETPNAARIATASRVAAAKRNIPHFYVTHEAEISQLDQLRQSLNADTGRPRVSVTHMILRALGLALANMPNMNRIWVNDEIIRFETSDIGLVSETENGLRIPVLRDVAGQSLDDVAAQTRAALERARGGMLDPKDVGECAISLSNVGMFGVSSLTPIINPPNAMILGVGADRHLFRPDDAGAPVARRELTLTLAADHRIIDGADAARFLSAVVTFLENPLTLMRPPKPKT